MCITVHVDGQRLLESCWHALWGATNVSVRYMYVVAIIKEGTTIGHLPIFKISMEKNLRTGIIFEYKQISDNKCRPKMFPWWIKWGNYRSLYALCLWLFASVTNSIRTCSLELAMHSIWTWCSCASSSLTRKPFLLCQISHDWLVQVYK